MSHVPNAASNGALIQHSGTSPNQKAYLPSPFELKDPQILDRVYLTHVNDDEICDTKILFDLVSTVVLQSVSQIPATSFKPEFSTLKLISCQVNFNFMNIDVFKVLSCGSFGVAILNIADSMINAA